MNGPEADYADTAAYIACHPVPLVQSDTARVGSSPCDPEALVPRLKSTEKTRKPSRLPPTTVDPAPASPSTPEAKKVARYSLRSTPARSVRQQGPRGTNGIANRTGRGTAAAARKCCPRTPAMMKRAHGKKKVKSTEELEMEKISEMRKASSKRRVKATMSLKKSAASVGYLGPARSEKELTIPVEFNLATSRRVMQRKFNKILK